MKIEISITDAPIVVVRPGTETGTVGAVVEFLGTVRGEENSAAIRALRYEAYESMARMEMERILQDLGKEHPCEAVQVIHRIGIVPVGEASIYVSAAARHRAPAFALVAEFMNRLKDSVPIWKTEAIH